MRYSYRFLLACLLLMSLPLIGQANTVTKVGTTAAPFLEIMPGTRASAMGGAFVALADDASALYFNPAGVARLGQSELVLTHSEWLADMDFNYAGLVVSLGNKGTLGASLTALSMPEMDVRTVEEPEGTGEKFSMGDIAMQLTYAINLTDRFSLGMSGKYIRQSIWHMTASTAAFDIGTIYTTRFYGMRIGATLSNFGGGLRMEGKDTMVNHDIDPDQMGNNDQIPADLRTESWDLPLNFQVGVALDLMHSETNLLTVTTDAQHPNNNTESVNLGLEYGFKQALFLRAGYKNMFEQDVVGGLTLGAGFQLNVLSGYPIRLDYAFQDFDYLNSTHWFGMYLGF